VLVASSLVLGLFQSRLVLAQPSDVWVDDDYPEGEDTDGDAYFRTIQAAINAVADGARYTCRRGTTRPRMAT